MAVYYKWIKGCSAGSALNSGCWSYLQWGEAANDTTSALPKLYVKNGKDDTDGSGTDLGYILTNKAMGITIEQDWVFDGIVYTNTIQSTDENQNQITLTGSKINMNQSLNIEGELSSQDIYVENDIVVDRELFAGLGISTSSGNISTGGGNIYATGDVYTSSGNIYATKGYVKAGSYCEAQFFNATSDKRAKENIQLATYSALDIIHKLPVYNYNYKSKPEETVTGILAQDLLEAQPEGLDLVSNINATGENNDYMSIKNDKLMFVLIKAIQEQQEQIEALKAEIEKLKA